VSRCQLDQGDTAFLWSLAQLTSLQLGGTKLAATQLAGLTALQQLSKLDASGTLFDDACCALLALLAKLRSVK
jgi:hypothetical protein